jgi:hypothetical protein
VSGSSCLIESSSTVRALYHSYLLDLLGLLDQFLVLLSQFSLLVLFQDSSKGNGLSLPFGHLLVSLLLLDLLLSDLSLFHKLCLLLLDHPVILNIELLSLLLKYFLAVCLMFRETVWIEFSAAPCLALFKLGRVVLFDVDLVFLVELSYRFIFDIIVCVFVVLSLKLSDYWRFLSLWDFGLVVSVQI